MPISKYTIGVTGDMCQCGRKRSVIHCPYCGSTSTRTYANPRYHKHMNGDVKLVDKLRHCNACGENFTNDEREACDATPIGAADAARKLQMLAEAESSPNLKPDEQAAAVTAKKLLDELRTVEQPSAAEIKALNILAKQAGETITPEERYQRFRILEIKIIGEYNEECYTYRQRGQEHPDTLEEFVEKTLISIGEERVPNPKGENANEVR